jgi:hypothetical protein
MSVINKNKIYLTNLFIIDWDDTLFPTSWINKNSIDFNRPNTYTEYKIYFLELDKTISGLLESLNRVGDVWVVTNASIKWIKSCLMILNQTRETIIKNNIRIVSARDSYSQNNSSPTEWKILTFQDIIEDILSKISKNMKPNTYINIISIGDAMYEYIALMNLDNFLKSFIEKKNINVTNSNDKTDKQNQYTNFNYLLKNVKFIEKPEFNLVIDQMNVLDKNKETIINKLEFIDLKFSS